jgi:PAS domain S-box-containing protein
LHFGPRPELKPPPDSADRSVDKERPAPGRVPRGASLVKEFEDLMIERSGGGQPGFSGAPNVSIGLRELLDAAPDVIFCCDARGNFVWLSAAMESLCGQRSADLLGRSFTKVVPSPQRRHLAHAWTKRARHLDQSAHTDVTLVVGQDSREKWVSIRSILSVRPDGDLVFIGVARPMSEAEVQALAAQAHPAASAVAVKQSARAQSDTQRASLGIMSGPTAIDPEHTAFAGPFGSSPAEGLVLEGREPEEPLAPRAASPPAGFAPPRLRLVNDVPIETPQSSHPAPDNNPEIVAAIQQAHAARAEAESRLAELQ